MKKDLQEIFKVKIKSPKTKKNRTTSEKFNSIVYNYQDSNLDTYIETSYDSYFEKPITKT
jgi:hypothetical protein